MHSLEISYPISENKMKKKKRREGSECVCADGWSLQGPPTFIRNSCPPWLRGPTPGYSVATWAGFDSPLGEVFMMANLARRFFFHYPPPSPFTSNLKARPWLSLWSREDKDVGPSGLTPRAQLSITASPPLSPFTPGSWTHGCQPGNNPQTMEA